MKKRTNRVPHNILARLKEARRVATFDNASFGDFGNKTDEVRELTRLYRESWLLPELDAVIAWAEGEKEEWR